MAQVHKLVRQTKIRADGNVFHELIGFKPNQLSNISPGCVQGCHLQQGQWGTVGSTVVWNYTLEGIKRYGKDMIKAIDDEKKMVTYKVMEGDLVKEYKSFEVSLSVDTNGKENVVTWTLEYEKLNEDDPEPNAFMELLLGISKDIDRGITPISG